MKLNLEIRFSAHRCGTHNSGGFSERPMGVLVDGLFSVGRVVPLEIIDRDSSSVVPRMKLELVFV